MDIYIYMYIKKIYINMDIYIYCVHGVSDIKYANIALPFGGGGGQSVKGS